MTLTRRRFLAIAAAAVGAGPAAAETAWRGRALGAEVEITLRGGDRGATAAALAAARAELEVMERRFSLHRSDSDLGRLNREGVLRRPGVEFLALLALCDRVHAATEGRFDPTIQPLWALLARAAPDAPASNDLSAARKLIGWQRVAFDARAVRLPQPGMALTLNGIAQGFATDRVAARLADHGFAATLVNIGELRAGEGIWRVGIADPAQGLIATRTLTRAAIATSSPGALRFGRRGTNGGPTHILDPRDPAAAPRWATVSTEAEDAALADGLSTALCFAPLPEIRRISRLDLGISRILLVDPAGNIRTI